MKLEANLPVGIFPIDSGASCLSRRGGGGGRGGNYRPVVSDSLRIPIKKHKILYMVPYTE